MKKWNAYFVNLPNNDSLKVCECAEISLLNSILAREPTLKEENAPDYFARHPHIILFSRFMEMVEHCKVCFTGVTKYFLRFNFTTNLEGQDGTESQSKASPLKASPPNNRRGVLYISPPYNATTLESSFNPANEAKNPLDILKNSGKDVSMYILFPEDHILVKFASNLLMDEIDAKKPFSIEQHLPLVEGLWDYDIQAKEFVPVQLQIPRLIEFRAFYEYFEQTTFEANIEYWDNKTGVWTSSKVKQIKCDMIPSDENRTQSHNTTPLQRDSSKKPLAKIKTSDLILARVQRKHAKGNPLPPEQIYLVNVDSDRYSIDFPQTILEQASEMPPTCLICFISCKSRFILKTSLRFLLRISTDTTTSLPTLLMDLKRYLRKVNDAVQDNVLQYSLSLKCRSNLLRARLAGILQSYPRKDREDDMWEYWTLGLKFRLQFINPKCVKSTGLQVSRASLPVDNYRIMNLPSDIAPTQSRCNTPVLEMLANERPAALLYRQFCSAMHRKEGYLERRNEHVYEIYFSERRPSGGILLIDMNHALGYNRFLFEREVIDCILSPNDAPDFTKYSLLFLDAETNVLMETTCQFLSAYLIAVHRTLHAEELDALRHVNQETARSTLLRDMSIIPTLKVFLPSLEVLMQSPNDFDFDDTVTREIRGIWKATTPNGRAFEKIFPIPSSMEVSLKDV